MRRKPMSEKILGVVEGYIKENVVMWFPYKGFYRAFNKYEGCFYQSLRELKSRGFLEEIEIKGERYLKTTPKGKLKLIQKKILKKWDGLWRIIAFDISEKRKKTRDVFRLKLQAIGCLPIQKSVWITPRDISADLEELLEILNLESNVDYFISKAVTNEEKYLKMFNLDDSKINPE